MATFEVLIEWTDTEGKHAPGDTVELDTGTPAQQVEVDKLVRYGIIQEKSAEQGSSSTKKK